MVASTLEGSQVTDFIWGQEEGEEIRGDAIAGNKLNVDNLHSLTNGILPIWVHRFRQTSNQDPSSTAKIKTPITSPFTLTIESDYLGENEERSYTSSLVGFILHVETLNKGHYTA